MITAENFTPGALSYRDFLRPAQTFDQLGDLCLQIIDLPSSTPGPPADEPETPPRIWSGYPSEIFQILARFERRAQRKLAAVLSSNQRVAEAAAEIESVRSTRNHDHAVDVAIRVLGAKFRRFS